MVLRKGLAVCGLVMRAQVLEMARKYVDAFEWEHSNWMHLKDMKSSEKVSQTLETWSVQWGVVEICIIPC